MKPRIIFVIGPTATGKSAVAVALAKRITAEIISCDSMQVYQGMDILTSKPPASLRKAVPHHLISAVSSERQYDVFRYYKEVSRKLKDIIGRGKIPLITGGTGLYMSVLLDGIFQNHTPNPGIRNRLYKEAETKGKHALYKRLRSVDPESAAKIHPNDTKRIVRALEVFEAAGQPISELQKQRKGLAGAYRIKIFGLDMPRTELYRKVEARVEKMFKQGLVREVRNLLKLKLSRTAGYAIGIREIKGYLDGLYGLEEAKLLIKKNTRNYAKRQLTWFRKDKRINWVKVKGTDKPAAIAARIKKMLKG